MAEVKPAATTNVAHEATNTTRKNVVENLRAEIRKMSIGAQLADLKNGIKDGRLREMLYAEKEKLLKMVMEQELNKAASGKFMQMKLEGLLSDPAFCEAAKECPKPKAKSLEKLFSTTAIQREKNNPDSH